MGEASIRILVVDDYEPFRRFVQSAIHARPEFQIVGETSNGLEAVRSAAELDPDLMLLDIGLPKLNGIEAARRIRERSPKSKILFFSENRSAEVVQEALSTGAGGYLLKSDAARELFAAIEAVLQGKPFLSSSLAGHPNIGDKGNDFSPRVSAPTRREEEIVSCHEVVFYSEDRQLIHKLARFVGKALSAGNAAVVVATDAHKKYLLHSLPVLGVDVAAAIEQGRLVTMDAADVVSICMVNGMFDSVRLKECFGSLIIQAANATEGKHGRNAVFGESVDLLLKQGNPEAAIQDEKLGNELCKAYPVDILCGYSLDNLQDGRHEHLYQQICAEHSTVHRV